MCQHSCERSDERKTLGSPRIALSPFVARRYGVFLLISSEHVGYLGRAVAERSHHDRILQHVEGDREGAVSEA